MFLYGGLINSRISNDTTSLVLARLEKLASYRAQHNVTLYLSNIVMRIPGYNGDFEEPWYWANYGFDIYSYSYFADEYTQTEDPAALANAEKYKALVPANALQEFLWRRQRNHNVTVTMVDMLTQGTTRDTFQYLYITLDDNALYGYNIREAAELKIQVAELQPTLQARIPIYPGADEVQLTMLSRFSVDQSGAIAAVKLGIIYRDPVTVQRVPNFEGQPMNVTLFEQIAAAGVIPIVLEDVDMNEDVDALLLVNNFSEQHQLEAAAQPPVGSPEVQDMDFVRFKGYIASKLNSQVLGFCDNRYSNGADNRLIAYMQRFVNSSRLETVAYAGWNTDGNTIGTVVSNTVLLQLFWGQATAQRGNAAFTSLRLLEDGGYQASMRQTLIGYVQALNPQSFSETTSNLAPSLGFYTEFAFKPLASYYDSLIDAYGLSWKLDRVYYPWNRTFEAGFFLTSDQGKA